MISPYLIPSKSSINGFECCNLFLKKHSFSNTYTCSASQKKNFTEGALNCNKAIIIYLKFKSFL